MGDYGGIERAAAQAAEGKDSADAGHEKYHERAGDEAEMEARRVVPQAMNVQVDETEGQPVDDGRDAEIQCS
jgi:hypothetical protein